MSNEPKIKETTSEVEYAFGEVPASARKKLGTILVILTGYTISLSNFVTGATVGFKMPFKEAVLACAAGNILLIIVATLLGIISCQTGLTTSVLARKSIGARSSSIVSLLLALSAVNWIAVNADTFSNLIISNFSWWPIPVAITSILVVAIWAQSAIRGVKGLEFVSWLGTPCAVLLTIICAAMTPSSPSCLLPMLRSPLLPAPPLLPVPGSSAASSLLTFAVMPRSPLMWLSAAPSLSRLVCLLWKLSVS